MLKILECELFLIIIHSDNVLSNYPLSMFRECTDLYEYLLSTHAHKSCVFKKSFKCNFVSLSRQCIVVLF